MVYVTFNYSCDVVMSSSLQLMNLRSGTNVEVGEMKTELCESEY